MNLQTSLSRQLENPNLNRNQRAELCCELARVFEDRGDYESARETLGEFWRHIGEHPDTSGLEQVTAGEVLLRAGFLTSILGSKNQITGAQETAKNLFSESLTIFESLGYGKKIAEAQTELALCYWREGAYDEARVMLRDALSRLSTESELKAKAILRSAIVEYWAAQHGRAFRILTDNAALFEKLNNHTLIGSFHDTLAGLLEDSGTPEYTDRAFVEYAAASYHFEQAGHKYYRAHVENNLGFLYFKVGRYAEAHEHLNYARRLLMYLKDSYGVAENNETRARVFLAEGNYPEAEKIAGSAVSTLEKSGQQGLLAEALITYGTALARLGYYGKAHVVFEHAIEVSQQAGAVSHAKDAALKMVQELSGKISGEAQVTPSSGSLDEDIRSYERNLIKEALTKARGSISQAARLLGTSHQELAYILSTRQKDLMPLRTPAKSRRKRKP
jgi:tetratricopeptide (TPR) repeat protein